MTIGFIEPIFRVFEDYYIEPQEVEWFGQEITRVALSSIMVTIFMAFIVAVITGAVSEQKAS